jgi:hypothetical protein
MTKKKKWFLFWFTHFYSLKVCIQSAIVCIGDMIFIRRAAAAVHAFARNGTSIVQQTPPHFDHLRRPLSTGYRHSVSGKRSRQTCYTCILTIIIIIRRLRAERVEVFGFVSGRSIEIIVLFSLFSLSFSLTPTPSNLHHNDYYNPFCGIIFTASFTPCTQHVMFYFILIFSTATPTVSSTTNPTCVYIYNINVICNAAEYLY